MAENFESSAASSGSSGKSTSHGPSIQVVGGLIMIIAFLGIAVAVGRLEAKPAAPAAPAPTPEPAAAPSTAAAKPAAETPPEPSHAEAAAAEMKEIKSQLAQLASQVKGLQGTIESLPKPVAPPDITPIQSKVEDLSKSVAVIAPLPEKVGKIDEQLGAVGKQIGGLEGEVAALKKELKTALAARRAPASESSPKASAETPKTDTAMNEAMDLFKKARYKDALDRLRKLTDANSSDARAWYYAALTSGLSSGDWTGGDAVAFVKKGVECEKAGTPSSDKIDAAFADLSPQTGKDWLSFYRKSAK